MIDPRVVDAYMRNQPNNLGAEQFSLFRVIATGEVVVYPTRFIAHPAFIGTIEYYITTSTGYGQGGYGQGGYGGSGGNNANYPSTSNYPNSTNYPLGA